MRLIDGDELLTAFPVDDEPMLTKSCVRMTIRRMPTVDAVPVVRCKDCRFRQSRVSRIIDGKECNLCEMIKGYKPADWYCADGERKKCR